MPMTTDSIFRGMIIASVGFAAVISSAHWADLSGVWASDPSVCDKVFVKPRNRTSFAKTADLHGSGFIIDGNRITGKIVRCTIKLSKEDGSLVHLIAAFLTDIALSTMQFSVKIIDDTKIARVFP